MKNKKEVVEQFNKNTDNLCAAYERLHSVMDSKQESPDFDGAVKNFLSHTGSSQTMQEEYYLLVSLLEYLHYKAPDNEQNLFMVVVLIDSGIQLDYLFALLREYDAKHIAFRHYEKFRSIAGEKADVVVASCRRYFSVIGNKKNVFRYINNDKDIEILAKIIITTFAENKQDLYFNELNNYLKKLYDVSQENRIPVEFSDINIELYGIDKLKEFYAEVEDNSEGEKMQGGINHLTRAISTLRRLKSPMAKYIDGEDKISWQNGDNNMTIQGIEMIIKAMIAEQLDIEKNKVTYKSHFVNDLGADSIDLAELLLAIEIRFDVEILALAPKIGLTLEDVFNTFFETAPREFIKRINSRIVCFRFRPDGKIEVSLKFEDGSWCFADGTTVLPSTICLLAISRWANILKELEDIINDPRSKEADLQKYFETYPELLAGNDYDVVLPQAVIIKDDNSIRKPDFVLTPKNQYELSKILELKIPQLNLANKIEHEDDPFSNKLLRAIRQIKRYSDAFDNKMIRERFRKTYNVDVFRPELHLIAGRKWDIKLMDSFRQLRSESQVKIEDWDSVLERLKRNYT